MSGGPCIVRFDGPPVNRQTHTTENITFPQLRWRAGKTTEVCDLVSHLVVWEDESKLTDSFGSWLHGERR